jgi:hypothetical protein
MTLASLQMFLYVETSKKCILVIVLFMLSISVHSFH